MSDNIAPSQAPDTAECQPANAPRIVARYLVATLGSRTVDGGTVRTASSQIYCRGDVRVARVGDEVHYPDGTIATITSGTGFAATENGKPLAIVGSHVGNGDKIVDTPNREFEIFIYENTPAIPGFLDPQYMFVPPATQG